MPPPNDQNVSIAILKYLVGNPAGMDTLDGIARFWVLRQRIEEDLRDIEKAIAGLLEQQFITERVLRNNSGEVVERYYGLNSDRLDVIRKLLRDNSSVV